MSYCPPESQVGLAALVHRIARELVAARDHLHNVEMALDHALQPREPAQIDTVSTEPVQSLSHIARLQSLDLVMQLLAELAGCLDRLSHEPALIQAGCVDAQEILRGLRLADLQRRLGNATGSLSAETTVELF